MNLVDRRFSISLGAGTNPFVGINKLDIRQIVPCFFDGNRGTHSSLCGVLRKGEMTTGSTHTYVSSSPMILLHITTLRQTPYGIYYTEYPLVESSWRPHADSQGHGEPYLPVRRRIRRAGLPRKSSWAILCQRQADGSRGDVSPFEVLTGI
jgi:hypothetical protein